MVSAISAVANGGTWNEPRVVRAMVKDGVRTLVAPKEPRRAISPQTVSKLLPILEAVVEEGTAKKAQLASYTVAGKTGTADKLINGRYSGAHQNVSFVGFAPSRRPALAAIVMVDTPRVGSDTGGEVAAPIFQRIADAALRYLGVPPTINPAPPIVVARNDALPGPTPALGPVVTPSIVHVVSAEGLMPDLRLLSARAAVRTLSQLGLTPRLKGSGVVLDQSPEPGEAVERGSVVTLTLGRDIPRAQAGSGALP
jgi:membrane peptidoglycan carboxypeptidase